MLHGTKGQTGPGKKRYFQTRQSLAMNGAKPRKTPQGDGIAPVPQTTPYLILLVLDKTHP